MSHLKTGKQEMLDSKKSEYFEEDEKQEPSEKSWKHEYFEEDVKTDDLELIQIHTSHVCDACGKNYTSKGNLYLHVRALHKGADYPCGQFEYRANGKTHLKKHIQSVHEKIKHSCTLCDHQASTKGNLKIHIESVHEMRSNNTKIKTK